MSELSVVWRGDLWRTFPPPVVGTVGDGRDTERGPWRVARPVGTRPARVSARQAKILSLCDDWQSLASLRRAVLCARRTAYDDLRRLESLGLVETARQGLGQGSGWQHVYRRRQA